ncbi:MULTISPECIES: folate-binding protein YgfZ [Marinobacter]|uniref:Folate-binding protein YgfZ n=1 Tax=Marinobacter metalliresistant TaxID=2961995 RepID=A0ABZ2W1I1_9GAMM|nr:folate-binding protein YgfZ [Marinobacter sp. Arc7-DN-1]AXS84679.1 folate-binding protein [Marinobacter sp. Arc7-DN-1]
MTDPDTPVPAVADFPLPGDGWTVLNNRIVVRISGPGTDKFLQGQFSQNLNEVTAGRSPRAAASTPKGRAYCLTRMVRAGEDILMDFSTDLADDTISHLRKYLMLFRGTSMDVIPAASLVGILGNRVAETLAGNAINNLKDPGDSVELDTGFLVRTEPTAEGTPRFEFWQTTGDENSLDTSDQRPRADWYASEIAAGVASLTTATQESFVPQMLNWQHVGGIHFKKGCYTGQEVIARMHFLGQLKKSLFRFRIEQAGELPVPGSALVAGERSVGEVVNSVKYRNGSCELLAVVRHDACEKNLHPEGQPDAVLIPMPLPYVVPEREKSPQSDT